MSESISPIYYVMMFWLVRIFSDHRNIKEFRKTVKLFFK
jgi:hypothetical protein